MKRCVIGFFCMGLICSAGLLAEGASVDAAEAWQIARAAERGDAVAQYKMGSCYYYGKGGLPKDYREAAKWYQRAAEQGNARAQIALGLCYFHGHGVRRNYWRGLKLIVLPNGGLKKEK